MYCMIIFKHMCVASDSRTIVVAKLLFVEDEYEIGITVRSLGVRNYPQLPYIITSIVYTCIYIHNSVKLNE